MYNIPLPSFSLINFFNGFCNLVIKAYTNTLLQAPSRFCTKFVSGLVNWDDIGYRRPRLVVQKLFDPIQYVYIVLKGISIAVLVFGGPGTPNQVVLIFLNSMLYV